MNALILALALVLHVGASKTIFMRDIRSFSLTRAGVIDVRPGPGAKIVFVAKAPGQTTLMLVDSKGKKTCYDVTVS